MTNRWTTSTRASRLPGNWKSLRLKALERDGYRCTWVIISREGRFRCERKATEVDHIQRGDDHSLENLRGLCSEHHAAKTRREGTEQRMKNLAEVRKRFRREPEQVPQTGSGKYVPLHERWAA